jgi:hypothetical protein
MNDPAASNGVSIGIFIIAPRGGGLIPNYFFGGASKIIFSSPW